MGQALGIAQSGIGVLYTVGMIQLLRAASSSGNPVPLARAALLLICPILLIVGGALYLSARTVRWGAAMSAAGSAGVTAMVFFLLYTFAGREWTTGVAATATAVLMLTVLCDYISFKMIR